ncbi:MAG: DUF2244 domain-containing protein [Hyphomicrobium sp.]|nr:DUF2244 domain-containing protein [Hyphomicrobium sp.]
MTEVQEPSQAPPAFRAVLHPHRSLSAKGFLYLMLFLGGVSLVTGVAFAMMGAWPVLGFFGLDVLAVWYAFKINYRSGTAYELVELWPEQLTITRVKPSGFRRSFSFNPYWVRVLLAEWPDGSAVLKLISHGREFEFAEFLNPEEKKDFARTLNGVLAETRSSAVPA